MLYLLFILLVACIGAEIDPYKVLNIPSTASQKRIKDAYRKLALKYHPDKVKDKNNPANEERFAKIGAAYELLKNPKRKKEYDSKRRRQRNPFVNMWQQARMEDGGLGTPLTRYTYDTLVRKSGKPWLIVVYSNWNCRTCKSAVALFEEVCDQMRGMVKCGKINRDLDYQWVVNRLQIRRLPVMIARRGTDKSAIEYVNYQHGRTQARHVKNAIDRIYPKNNIQMIKTSQKLREFLTMDIHSTRGLVFSSKTDVPHPFMRHAATEFPNVRFGFVYTKKQDEMQKMRDLANIIKEGSVLLIINSVLPFSGDAEHAEIDLGIYKRDPSGLLSAIKERVEPDLPLLSFENFVDMCYSTDGKLDRNVRCFLYLFETTIPESVKQLVTRLQSTNGALRMAAVDCTLQAKFCEKLNYKQKPIFVGVAAYEDKFVPYSYPNDLSQFEPWASTVIDSLETCSFKTGVSFPEEQVDSYTRARRKLKQKMAPILTGANLLGSVGSSVVTNMWWLVETFFSVLFSVALPLLLFGSFFMQARRI